MKTGAIVIPVHNRRATTLACLRQLAVTGDAAGFRVMVVDDGSTDGTAEAVRAEYPDVELLRSDGELWWTGAVRLGMEQAFRDGATVVIWLNDDCLAEAGALARLSALIEENDADMIGPACLGDSDAAVPTGFIGRRVVAAPAAGSVRVDGLSGFCVAVSRRAWDRLGPPDAQKFPHYFGDSAYTLSATRGGLRVAVTGEARVRVPGYQPPLASPAGGSWHDAFVAKKSRFRLATLWNYLPLKYGPFVGPVLAAMRTVQWTFQFALARLS